MSPDNLSIARLYATPDGESHFEDVSVPLRDKGDIGYLSERIRATGMILRHTDGDYNYDWHSAPERQAIIILTGGVDIEASDGETRRFMAGDLFFAEDTTGRGHRSRAVDGLPRISVFVTFGDPGDQPGLQDADSNRHASECVNGNENPSSANTANV